MKKFLLVEDSSTVTKVLKHIANQECLIPCDCASTFAQAKNLLENAEQGEYLLAVVDLNLPDAPDGEVVDLTLSSKLPTIVLTGTFSEEKREQMLEKPIVDYIVKESRFSYEYIIKLVNRLYKNQNIKVLIADDSSISRKVMKNLLTTQLYQVIEADDGDTALETIQQHDDIKLLITDYHMPRMNGFDLVKNIRKDPSKNDLIIVGVSGQNADNLSAKFIKNGANDFLTKPFSPEEFHCRIMHDIENMEYIETIRSMAYTDWVTGLPNKRHFFDKAPQELTRAQSNQSNICLAQIGIDNLAATQNEYGISTIESIQKNLAELLHQAFDRFIYAVTGDSEVSVLLLGLDATKAATLLENFRALVEDHIVLLPDDNLSFTISAGLVSDQEHSLIELVEEASLQLMQARSLGGNQVLLSQQ